VFYSIGNANLDRLIKGYDDCGNICGKINDGNPFDNCGVSFTQYFLISQLILINLPFLDPRQAESTEFAG